jgi:hypothetical protein
MATVGYLVPMKQNIAFSLPENGDSDLPSAYGTKYVILFARKWRPWVTWCLWSKMCQSCSPKVVLMSYLVPLNQEQNITYSTAMIIDIWWGWMRRQQVSWWSQWLFRCLEVADHGGNVPCWNSSSVIQHNARSLIKLDFPNRHDWSIQSTVGCCSVAYFRGL